MIWSFVAVSTWYNEEQQKIICTKNTSITTYHKDFNKVLVNYPLMRKFNIKRSKSVFLNFAI